jgi:hypothetical protein
MIILVGVFTITAACLTPSASAGRAEKSSFEQDRKAILAMAGDYKVKFEFRETVAVEPGYELKETYTTDATEFVKVLEDTGSFISLQHVLVVQEAGMDKPEVVKHWRQDWTYEDTEMTVFRGNNTWEHVSVSPAEVTGTWTQAVYEVSDAPRYESAGRWVHVGDRSAWESGETWRPLPRREYTTRDDYGVIVARNRHTITPTGWVHEQDNQKLVIDAKGNPVKVLAHETGLNVYDHVDDVDFSAGVSYWEATKPFWQDVRDTWAEILDKPGRVTLLSEVKGKRLNREIFTLAAEVNEAGTYDAKKMTPVVRKTINAFVGK